MNLSMASSKPAEPVAPAESAEQLTVEHVLAAFIDRKISEIDRRINALSRPEAKQAEDGALDAESHANAHAEPLCE